MSDQHSLFNTPTDKVLEGLSSAVRKVFEPYLAHPPLTAAEIVRGVDEFIGRAEAASRLREFVDLESARKVATLCKQLLEGLPVNADSEVRLLVQAAALYVALERDADHDWDSPIGFDDDLEVVRIVASAIGRVDLLEGI